MTEQQAIEVISAAFAAAWPAASGYVPFALENRTLKLPPESDTFALLTTVTTNSDQLTSGESQTRLVGRNGWIVVKLWGPASEGRRGLALLVEVVRGIFEMKSLPLAGDSEEIDTQASSTQTIGTDGRWFMLMVRTPYTVYETK